MTFDEMVGKATHKALLGYVTGLSSRTMMTEILGDVRTWRAVYGTIPKGYHTMNLKNFSQEDIILECIHQEIDSVVRGESLRNRTYSICTTLNMWLNDNEFAEREKSNETVS